MLGHGQEITLASGIFLHDHPIITRRDRSTGEDADCGAGRGLARPWMPCRGLADDGQRAVQILGSQRVAVHRRGIEGGLGQSCDCRPQQRTTRCLIQADGLWPGRAGQRKHMG